MVSAYGYTGVRQWVGGRKLEPNAVIVTNDKGFFQPNRLPSRSLRNKSYGRDKYGRFEEDFIWPTNWLSAAIEATKSGAALGDIKTQVQQEYSINRGIKDPA